MASSACRWARQAKKPPTPQAGSRSSHRKGGPAVNAALPPWASAICRTSLRPVPWAAPPSASNWRLGVAAVLSRRLAPPEKIC